MLQVQQAIPLELEEVTILQAQMGAKEEETILEETKEVARKGAPKVAVRNKNLN